MLTAKYNTKFLNKFITKAEENNSDENKENKTIKEQGIILKMILIFFINIIKNFNKCFCYLLSKNQFSSKIHL